MAKDRGLGLGRREETPTADTGGLSRGDPAPDLDVERIDILEDPWARSLQVCEQVMSDPDVPAYVKIQAAGHILRAMSGSAPKGKKEEQESLRGKLLEMYREEKAV